MPRPPASIRAKQSARDKQNKSAQTDKTGAILEDIAAGETGSLPTGSTATTNAEFEGGTSKKPEILVSSSSDAARPGSRRKNAAARGEPVTPVAVQPHLFTVSSSGTLVQPAAEIPPLTPESTLEEGRWWFRHHLEQLNRPHNTIASYMYDLSGFEDFAGKKPLADINREDVNLYLIQSNKKSTRKRRLTSMGAFFKYLINTFLILY